jgi:transcription initiation factor TFIID subunit 1
VYVLKPGGQIPVEGELRKIITPDQWCAYESMRCGVLRLKDLGLAHHLQLAQVPADRLRLAFEQLPPSPVRCHIL